MPGGTETELGSMRRPGEQEQEQQHARRQRDHGAEAGRGHAHLADDTAEQRAGSLRAVPRLVERSEPFAASVHAAARLRRGGPELGPTGVRLLLRRAAHERDGPVSVAADRHHRLLDGLVHGRVLVRGRSQHGKRLRLLG